VKAAGGFLICASLLLCGCFVGVAWSGPWWEDPALRARGEAVFEAKCMGCHHQTVYAFGPSFREVARGRSPAQIQAYIADPRAVGPALGYPRPTMPVLGLSDGDIRAVTAYILVFRE
jgi:mono/diheme cytochrome c family protein